MLFEYWFGVSVMSVSALVMIQVTRRAELLCVITVMTLQFSYMRLTGLIMCVDRVVRLC